jgi:hypothetical protein
VETVTLDALVEQRARQRKSPDKVGLGAVKCRVKRGNLRQTGAKMADCLDQPDALQLMQRGQRYQGLDLGESLVGD